MRSLTLSQWRDLRIGVICEDLGTLKDSDRKSAVT